MINILEKFNNFAGQTNSKNFKSERIHYKKKNVLSTFPGILPSETVIDLVW